MNLRTGLARLGGVVALAALMLSLGLASVPAAHAQLNLQMTVYGPAENADTVGRDLGRWRGLQGRRDPARKRASSTGYLWATTIAEGECGAGDGSVLTFTINGEAAAEEGLLAGRYLAR